MLDTQQTIIQALHELDDELDIYDYFIAKALRFPCPGIRQPEHQIKGCVSGLWVQVQLNDGRLTVYADSDSLIIRGIAAAICEIYTGMTPEQARACPITFLEGLELAD